MTLLKVETLRKSFGGLRAVDGLSFEVAEGEVMGLLGPNGSGKTTAMNLISGALNADSGSIKLGSDENVQAGMAYRKDHKFGAQAHAEALELLALVGLSKFADTPAVDLTYIDQKRLELARALALKPRLLLLDEWLAGVNPTELQEGIKLIRNLRAQGLTVILVEHVMEAVRALCDRCVVMLAGAKLAEGKTEDVLAQEEVITAYLGAPHV